MKSAGHWDESERERFWPWLCIQLITLATSFLPQACPSHNFTAQVLN